MLLSRGNRLLLSATASRQHQQIAKLTSSLRGRSCNRLVTARPPSNLANGGICCRRMANVATSSSPPPPPPNAKPGPSSASASASSTTTASQQQSPSAAGRPEVIESIKPPRYEKPRPHKPLVKSKRMAYIFLLLALVLGIPSAYVLYQDVKKSREEQQKEIDIALEKIRQERGSQQKGKGRQEREELATEVKTAHAQQQHASPVEEEGEEPQATGNGQQEALHQEDQSQSEIGITKEQEEEEEFHPSFIALRAEDQQQRSNLEDKSDHELDVHSLTQHIELPQAPQAPNLEELAQQVMAAASSPTSAVELASSTENSGVTEAAKTPYVDANETVQILRELYQLKLQDMQQQNEKYVQSMRETLLAEFASERKHLLKIIDDREQLYQQNMQNALELRDRQHTENLESELTNLNATKQAEMESALKAQRQQMLDRFTEEKREVNEFIDMLSARLTSLEQGWSEEIPSYIDRTKRAAMLAGEVMKLSDVVEAPNAGYVPFKPEFDAVMQLGRGDEVVEVITGALLRTDASLPSVGVPTHQQLQQRFENMRKLVLRTEYTPAHSGFVGRALGIVLSSMAVPEFGLVDGDSVDARLARARHFMKTNRLEDAINEIEQLPRSQLNNTYSWLGDAHRRLSVVQAVQVLKLHVGSAFPDKSQ